jgi:hypothetical protein
VVEPAGRSVATVRIVHCQHIRGAVQAGACSGARTVRSFPEHKWTASSFFRPPPLTWGIAEPNETKRCSSRLRFSPVTSRISQDKALSTTAVAVRRANGASALLGRLSHRTLCRYLPGQAIRYHRLGMRRPDNATRFRKCFSQRSLYSRHLPDKRRRCRHCKQALPIFSCNRQRITDYSPKRNGDLATFNWRSRKRHQAVS